MNIDFEELHVFDNSKSKYVPREMYEKAQADADRRLELLKEVQIRREAYQEACLFCSGLKKCLPDCELVKELADAKK